MKKALNIVWTWLLLLSGVAAVQAQTLESREVRTICEGDSLVIDYAGQHMVIREACQKTFTYRVLDPVSGVEVDSVHILTINVAPLQRDVKTVYLAQGETLFWYGQTITQSGTYQQTVSSGEAGDCPVVHELIAQVSPDYIESHSIRICENELPYYWRGLKLSQSGTYRAVAEGMGAENYYEVTLEVLPRTYADIHWSVCNNEQVEFNGKTYGPGVYTDTLVNANGCDSIVRIIVHRLQSDTLHSYVNISDQQTYSWSADPGKTYSEAGDYYITTRNDAGCDSVLALHLRVWPTFHIDTVADVCQGELPYLWHGMELNSAGTYYDSHTTIHGFDSIYTLQLNVAPMVVEEVNLNLCKGDSVTWNGKKYYQGGVYQDIDHCTRAYRIIINEYVPREYFTVAWMHGSQTFHWRYGKNNEHEQSFNEPGVYQERIPDPVSGCYDIYKLELHQGTSFFSEEEATICEGETFIWHGRDLSHANVGTTTVYYDSLQTVHGNDSVYKLTLTVGKVYHVHQSLSVCKGGTITWNGLTYTAGIYRDTLKTILGCDSIVETIVTEANTYYIEESITITAGESLHWHGREITKDGDYYYYGRTTAGCDSTLVLHVSVTPAGPESWLITTDDAICEGETYTWRGRDFYTSGTYYDSLKCITPAQAGKDSVYMLRLTVYPVYKHITKHLYACNGGEIRFNGVIYTQEDEGAPIEVPMKTIHGCDSIITLYVHFNAGFEQHDTLRFTNQETRLWQGQTISASGDYTAPYISTNGCDSIYYLHAEVTNIFVHESDTAICETQAPFQWMGMEIPRRIGTYSYEHREQIVVDGEPVDMLYRIHVTMYPVYEVSKQLTICDGASVTYYGQVFDQPGDFDITVKSAGNCDSIIHVHVNQLPSYHHVTEAFINLYKKGTYTWMGTTYNQPGTYTIQKENEFGCEQIEQLVLKPLPVQHDTATVCQSDLPYVWRGRSYTNACDVEDFARDEHHNDTAMYTLHLEVRPIQEIYLKKDYCKGESVVINGVTYTDDAADVIEYNRAANGCDSIVHYALDFHEAFHSIENRYLRDDESFIWHGQTVDHPGHYTDSYISVFGCDSTSELYVFPLKVIETRDGICESDTPYVWMDRTYYSSAEDIIVVLDRNGLDSAEYRLYLDVLPQPKDTIVQNICPGTTYTFYGQQFSGETDTVIYVPTGDVCEKEVRILLHEITPITYGDTIYLRNGETTEWRGKTIPTNNSFKTYTDIVQSQEGCDSVRYFIDVRKMDSIATDTTICANFLPFYWEYDQTYYHHADTLHYILQDQQGRDSIIYALNLKVLPVFDTIINVKICDTNLPYYFRDDMGHTFIYEEEGNYTDTIPTLEGCDSIFHFNISVYPSYPDIYTADTICETELPYVVAGQEFWNEGNYLIQTKTAACNCDSTVDLRLVIRPTMTKNDSVVMCKEDLPFYLGDTAGVRENHPLSKYKGLPFYNDTVIWDCDHTHFFHVIVRDPIPMDDIYFCEGDSVLFGYHNDGTRRWIYETGVYYDTISSTGSFAHGPDDIRCDSILRVNAYRLPRDTTHKTVHILSDSTYEFYGRQLSMSGLYYAQDTLEMDWTGTDMSKRRCNDIIALHLVVDTVYRFRDSVHVCMPVDSFYYHQWPGGHWQGDDGYLGPDGEKKKLKISHSGIYTDSLRRETTRLSTDNYYKNFKDSIYTLVVTMDTAYRINQTANLCKGDSLSFNEGWIYNEGIYRDTLTTIHGCDSIVQLVVNFIPSFHIRLKDARISDKMLPYRWKTKDTQGGGQTHLLYNTGIYYDTLQSVLGCDSVLELHLEVAPSYLLHDTVHVCSTFNGEEHSYDFADGHHFVFSYSGDYYDSLRTATANPRWEPDSIYHLHVVTHYSERTRIDTIVCRDDSVMFNGQYIALEGIYYDTLRTMPRDKYDTCHCDSIIEWNIHFAEHYYIDEGLHYIAKGNSYLWHWQGKDTLLRTEGVYFDKYQSIHGCDSTYRIQISYAPTYLFEQRADTCQGDLPYRWHGTDYYLTGTYYDSLQTVLGFDSVYVLHLHVHDSAHVYINRSSCVGDSVFYNGRWLTKPGEYIDTLTTVLYGCDSIVHISYTQFADFYKVEEKTVSDKTLPYLWHGKQLDHTGIFYDSLQTIHGCDSIYELRLTVGQTYLYEDSVVICHRDLPYTWNYLGRDIRTYNNQHLQGDYTHKRTLVDSVKLQTVLGFDSIYVLHLGVLPTIYGDTLVRICEGDSAFIHGRYIATSGNYTDTLQSNLYGCDSIVRVTVTYLERAHTYLNLTRCQDDHFILRNGTVVTTDGTYTDTLKSHITACDSVIHYTIHFTERHVHEYDYAITDKETYSFFGEELNQPKTYTHVDTAMNGCDSLITILHLTVHPSIYFDSITSICQNETSIWQGYSINFSSRLIDERFDTIYVREYTTIHGADSVYRLHLTVLPTFRSSYTIQLCEGQSATYNGVSYDQQGIYQQQLKAENGCDSIVTVNVQVLPKYYYVEEAHTDDQHPYFWEKHNKSFGYTGIYYDSLQTKDGCDSIYELHLTVYPTYRQDTLVSICRSETPYVWHNRYYWNSGTYYDSLQTVMHYDSVFTLYLTVLDTAHTSFTAHYCRGSYGYTYNGVHYTAPGIYHDTLTCANGCDSIVTFNLQEMPTYFFSDTVRITDREGGHLWFDSLYTHTGTYYHRDTTSCGCDSIYELVLDVRPGTYYRDTTIWRCQSELPFVWGGHTYNESLHFADTVSDQGVDTIYRIELVVLPVSTYTLNVTTCPGATFSYNGKDYTSPGSYRDTLRATNGCDSIVTIQLQQITPQVVHEEKHISDKETYLWKTGAGHEYRLHNDGLFFDTLRTEDSMCDSIYYELRLHVWPTYHRDTTITICREDAPLTWNNRSYDSTGVYTDTLQTVMHYDSIWTLHLTVLEMERITVRQTVCEGDSFLFHGQYLYKDTFFYDTIPTSVGCGKIYNVQLQYRHPQRIYRSEKTSTTRLPFEWRPVEDKTYHFISTGTYEHIIRTADDLCDSIIYVLNLTVCPTYDFRLDTAICQNDLPYRWHDRDIYNAGVYYDSLQTVDGFDSIFTLQIREILPAYFGIQTVDLCEGSSTFVFRGKTYTEAGTFFDTIPTVGGCDSIFKITIRVHPRYERFDTIHISDQETYNFNGRTISAPGLYHDYLKSVTGCDSVVHLFLKVHKTYRIELEANICQKDTFYFGEKQRALTKSGVYTDSLLTRKLGDEGYDSIRVLTLNVWPIYYFDETYSICPGDSLYIRGRNVSKPGEYIDTLYSMHGCDSIYHFVVNEKRSYQLDYTYDICDGDSVPFKDGKYYGMAGDYYYRSPERCDIVEHMHLNVHKAAARDTTILVTPLDWPYYYNNRRYTKAGTYAYPMTTIYGCDSTLTVKIIETSKFSIDPEQVALCDNQAIRINNQLVSEPGTYRFYYRSNPKGELDSIRIVEVYRAASWESPITDTLTICQGDTAHYGSFTFTTAGPRDLRLKTIDGCDSILHIYVNVLPAYVMPPLVITTNDMEPYRWHGQYYDQTGVYADTLSSSQGCDSIETLRLTVIQSIRYSEEEEICMGDSLVWRALRDTVLRTPGLYVQTLTNQNSVYSYTMLLTVKDPVKLTKVTVDNLCADAPEFDIDLRYSGLPQTYTVLFDAAAHRAGLQDIVDAPFPGGTTLTIPMPQYNDSLYYDGTQRRNSYLSPGEYDVRVHLTNGACVSSEVMTTMQVLYPAWIIQQNWQDVVAVLDKSHNGGYDFKAFEWSLNGSMLTNATPYLYYPGGFTVGDKVGLRVSRYSGEPAIAVCEPLTITRYYNNDPDAHPTCSPTAVKKSAPQVQIRAAQEGQYQVSTTMGQLIDAGEYQAGKQAVQLPAVSGCYIIRMQDAEGRIWSEKILVY